MVTLLLALALTQAPATAESAQPISPQSQPEQTALQQSQQQSTAQEQSQQQVTAQQQPPANETAQHASQSQPLALVSVSNPALLAPELGDEVAAKVRAAISSKGIALQPDEETKVALRGRDPQACESNQTCLGLLAQSMLTPVLVRVEGSLVGQDIAVLLQGVAASDGTIVAEHSFVVSRAALSAGLDQQISPFTTKVSEALKTEPPVKLPDAPKQVVLEPPPTKADQIVTQAPPSQSPSRTPAIATGVATLAAAAVAIVFTANAVSDQNCLNGPPVNGHPTVCVTQGQANAVQQRANTGFTVGASAGGLAIALGAATAYLWTHAQD